MAGIDFNTSAVAAAIRAAAEQLEDMTPLFRDVTEYMVEATRKRFVQGKAPDGSTWAKKRPATLERYKQLGYGNLPKTLIGPGRRLSREIVGDATRSGSVIGSALIYSRVMQEGAAKGAFGKDRHGRPIPWGRIPARVFLGISPIDETNIIDIVDEHIGRPLEAD